MVILEMNQEQEIQEKLQAHREKKAQEPKATAEVKKFSKEELDKITEIKQTYDRITLRMGQLHFELQALTSEKSELESLFDRNRESEIKFAQDLNTKYGKGTLDIETGIFTPVE